MLQVSLSATPKISLTGCKSRSYTENLSVIVSHTLTAKIGPRSNRYQSLPRGHGWQTARTSRQQRLDRLWASDFVFKLNKDHAHSPTALAQLRQRYVLPHDTPHRNHRVIVTGPVFPCFERPTGTGCPPRTVCRKSMTGKISA